MEDSTKLFLQPCSDKALLRLLRGLYQFGRRAQELKPLGIDLFELASHEELIQGVYMAMGLPPEPSTMEDMDNGEHWDWAGSLHALADETDGSDEAFLAIVKELRDNYIQETSNEEDME